MHNSSICQAVGALTEIPSPLSWNIMEGPKLVLKDDVPIGNCRFLVVGNFPMGVLCIPCRTHAAMSRNPKLDFVSYQCHAHEGISASPSCTLPQEVKNALMLAGQTKNLACGWFWLYATYRYHSIAGYSCLTLLPYSFHLPLRALRGFLHTLHMRNALEVPSSCFKD